MPNVERGPWLTTAAVLFAILAISNLLKPLQIGGEQTGFVFLGERLGGVANTVAGPIFGVFLAAYAAGIWGMRRFALARPPLRGLRAGEPRAVPVPHAAATGRRDRVEALRPRLCGSRDRRVGRDVLDPRAAPERAHLMELAIGLGSGQTPSDRHGIAAMVDAAQTAEDLGFDAVVAPDHYVYEALGTLQTQAPAYDVFFVLATIAQRTTRLRLMSHVACMLFRHPAMHARLFAQIYEASGGRVVAGVGAGWTRAEFEMMGLLPDA
jgi:hypothetical protein